MVIIPGFAMTQKFTLCYVSLENNGLLSVVEEGKEKKLPLTLEDIHLQLVHRKFLPWVGRNSRTSNLRMIMICLPQAHVQIAYTSQLLMPTTTNLLNTSLSLLLTVP